LRFLGESGVRTEPSANRIRQSAVPEWEVCRSRRNLRANRRTQDPNDYAAIVQLGRIALLANRLDDAQMWLDRAIALHPDDADAKVMLAEAFWRRDDFQKAAAALNGVDVSSNQLLITQYPALNVAKLESFKGEPGAADRS